MKQKNWWRYLLSIPILALYVMPYYILVGVALRDPFDPASRWAFPMYFFPYNFMRALDGRIFMGMRDSLIITFFAVLTIVVIGSLAAYPLARNKSNMNRFIRLSILGVMMIPPLSIIVPLYRLMLFFDAISTYHGVVVLMATFQLPLAIFLFTNFISSIPSALDEAAAIDGCGPFRTFFSVIMPQLKPVTVSVVILTGVTCWNDYQFSLYFLQSPRLSSVTLAVSEFFAQVGSDPHAAAAAAAIGVLPLVVLFLFLQQYFIKGMIDSAIK